MKLHKSAWSSKFLLWGFMIISVSLCKTVRCQVRQFEQIVNNLDSLNDELKSLKDANNEYLNVGVNLKYNANRLNTTLKFIPLSDLYHLAKRLNNTYYIRLIEYYQAEEDYKGLKNINMSTFQILNTCIEYFKNCKDTNHVIECYTLQAHLILAVSKGSMQYLQLGLGSELNQKKAQNILRRANSYLDSARYFLQNYHQLGPYIKYELQRASYLKKLDFKKYIDSVGRISKHLIDTIQFHPEYNYFLPKAYDNLSQSFRYKDSSLYFNYIDSIEKYIRFRPNRMEVTLYSHRGFWYTENGYPNKAIPNLKKCTEFIQKYDTTDRQTLLACYYYLTYALSESKSYAQATEYAIKFIELEDDLQKEKAIYDFYNLDFSEQLNNKENEIQKQTEELHQKNKLNLALTGISVLLFTLLIALFYFIKKLHLSRNSLAIKIEENLRLQQAKEDLYAMLAHDIKSPMKENLMRIHLLEEIKENKTALFEEINELEKNSFNLLVLIDNILSYSTQNPVELSSKIETIALDIFFDNYVFPYIRIYEKSKRQLKIHWQKNLYLQGNPAHLSIIIRNLLDNSIKYSIENTVIEISLSQTTQQKIIFSVVNLTSENEKRLKSYIDYLVHTPPEPTIKNQFGLGSTLIKKYTNLYRYPISAELTSNKALSISIEFT